MLNMLCGFGVNEVAAAFLRGTRRWRSASRAGRRCSRARSGCSIWPTREVPQRLSAVQRALYLLFNEGYHGAHAGARRCAGSCASRPCGLAELLLANPVTSTPATRALVALMCLNAARLPARVDAVGQSEPALRAGSRALGSASSLRRASVCSIILRPVDDHGVPHRGGDRVASRAGAVPRGHELADDRLAVRHAHDDSPIAGRRTQSRDRGRAVRGRRARAGGDRGDCGDRSTAEYPFYFAALGELEHRRGARDDGATALSQRGVARAKSDGAPILRSARAGSRLLSHSRCATTLIRSTRDTDDRETSADLALALLLRLARCRHRQRASRRSTVTSRAKWRDSTSRGSPSGSTRMERSCWRRDMGSRTSSSGAREARHDLSVRIGRQAVHVSRDHDARGRRKDRTRRQPSEIFPRCAADVARHHHPRAAEPHLRAQRVRRATR